MDNRIRMLRKQRNMLQKDLASELGLASSTINQYEQGKRDPDIKTIIKIAQYFHVSVDYLCCLTNKETPESFSDPGAEYQSLFDLAVDFFRQRGDLGPSGDISDSTLQSFKVGVDFLEALITSQKE